jgi:quercetin dioxygenase-like cupin family protein
MTRPRFLSAPPEVVLKFAEDYTKFMRNISVAILIASAMLLANHSLDAAPPASAGVVHPVLSQPLPSQPGTDVTVITVDYPPGGSTPPHEHPGYTYAYVLEGAIVSKLDDQKEMTYKAGQMWTEKPHEHHMVSKNASPTEPARLLVFMIAPHGVPLVTMLPAKPSL